MKKPRYSTNLTKPQYKVIKAMLPKETNGRPPRCRHAVLNALWFVAVTGIQWRLLPREFPPWQTVYYHFRRWSRLGHWKRIHHLLRALVRQKMNRHQHPTAGCLDSQSVKTTSVAGVRGFDNGKKVKGRKRHLLCDIRPKGTRVWPWNLSSPQPTSQSRKALAWSAVRWAGGAA